MNNAEAASPAAFVAIYQDPTKLIMCEARQFTTKRSVDHAIHDPLKELIPIRTRTEGAVDFRNLRSTNRQ
jgi:hypothetical protein